MSGLIRIGRVFKHRGSDIAIGAAMPAKMFCTALPRRRMKEPNRVHRALLSEPVDAADALFEPQRVPRQLDVDDEPAAMMQVESLAGGIGRHQHLDASVVERIHRRTPLLGWQTAMDDADASR